MSSLTTSIKTKWDAMAPGQAFYYTFMDADFNNIYFAEQRTGKLLISFTVFAIFIACLGLFRLVTYGSKHRTREIGIGKVLGATANGVVAMLSKDFAWLVAFASLIAFPISWWDYEKLVAKFCLQDRYKLMGIRSCASCCAADYPVDCWLAGDKGRDCKSGEELRTD